jgi:hypothetical protein
VGATVGTTAAPDKRRQFREMGGADGLNDSNSSPATTFPVPKDRAAIRAGLLLREINPDRDRNENCSGYNQSTEDIFHLVRPLHRVIETLSEATVFILGRGRPWAEMKLGAVG